MSKEYLEALERIKNKFINFFHEDNPDVECIEDALQRLESIDNVKPSEALKITNSYLQVFEKENADVLYNIESFKRDFNTIKQALLKAQEQEKILDILKRIIKVKKSDVYEFVLVVRGTDEEEDTIKEWLENA